MALAQFDGSDLSAYVPRPVASAKNARYVLPDRTIAIFGYNDMNEILASLNAIFVQSHPGFRFHMELNGSATAAPALTLGVSAFAPTGAEFSAMELESYRSYLKADLTPIRVAHCSLDPRALSAPVGIFVNSRNPVERLTMVQVAHIFTAGSPGGDIMHWGQAGLTGEWATRSLHPCGIAEEAAAGLSAFMLRKMGGRPFTPDYEAFAQSMQVVQRVAEDPLAIGFASGNILVPGTKRIAIGKTEDGYFSSLTAEDVVNGKYPYDRYLYIYLRRTPGEPIDSLAKEYLRMVLSREGQRAIAAAPPKYLPLNAREINEELDKLGR